jgi:hypothetical protein
MLILKGKEGRVTKPSNLIFRQALRYYSLFVDSAGKKLDLRLGCGGVRDNLGYRSC